MAIYKLFFRIEYVFRFSTDEFKCFSSQYGWIEMKIRVHNSGSFRLKLHLQSVDCIDQLYAVNCRTFPWNNGYLMIFWFCYVRYITWTWMTRKLFHLISSKEQTKIELERRFMKEISHLVKVYCVSEFINGSRWGF